MHAYAGKILRIDLTKKKIKKQELKEEFAKKYIGGRGFGAKIIWDEVENVEPYDPKNKVVISSGPLAGTFLAGAGKTSFVSKSPLTYGYGDSNMGGHFACEMKYAGYDSIVIEGRSKKPTWIKIENENVEFKNAEHLWGKNSFETEKEIKKEFDGEVAVIGQGGENLVRYACITSDCGRQAGRAGIGAVFGSKALKGIGIFGDKDITIADYKKFFSESRKLFKDCFSSANLKPWQKYGTAQVVTWASEIEALPTKNFLYGTYENAEKISGEAMVEKCVKMNKACFACPMACGKYSYTKKYDKYVEGAEYETIALLGSNCGLEDIEDVVYANYLCDAYGIDTISTGNIIAFVMDCSKNDLIDEKINFGDANKMFELIRKIAFRERIGKILAEGVRYASEKFNASKYAVHIKGMEQSGYESRAAPAMALSYMTCDVGAHHNRSWAITHDIKVGRDEIEGKAEKVIELQHIRPMFDMLGVCRLQWVELNVDLESYAKLFSYATGWDYKLNDLLFASERIYNLTRAYWFREVKDFGRSYDYPPEKYSSEVEKGKTKGYKIEKKIADKLLDKYYGLRGWDSEGKPKKEKLISLDLEYVIGKIYED
ncbi:MAG: aldehyde ferredoxin oxidoreductase family protein [Candidatus Thermoplasmatota archaeon]